MASHCHPHSHPHSHHHYPNSPPLATTPSSSSCTCCCDHHHHHPPPLPPQQEQQITLDQLLQALAFLLQQQQPNNPQACPCLNQSHPLLKPRLHRPKNHAFHWDPQVQGESNHRHLVSSLVQRISNLESALGRFPSSSSGEANRSCFLREAAARVIQTRFRAFLVRRSRALRQLQELAYLKTSFLSLKSSVSSKTHFDAEVVSRKAMDLLLRVDSIEGGDPMIRDGKRSITRDLVRFLDFVDGFSLRRNVEKSRVFGIRYRNGKSGANQGACAEELKSRIERIRGFSRDCENDVELEGFQQFIDDGVVDGKSVAPMNRKPGVEKKVGFRPRSTKSVSFSENGNVYWVINDESEPVLNADIRYANGSDDHGEVVEKEFDIVEESRGMSRGEEDDHEVQSENERSSESSDGERIPKGGLRGSGSHGSNRYFRDRDGNTVFSAPRSAKIEQSAEPAKKRQGVKIIG